MDEAGRIRRERLRWRCRRALLELDIVLRRFWERGGGPDDGMEEAALERLLAMDDPELWDLVSGRTPAGDPQLARMVERINGRGA